MAGKRDSRRQSTTSFSENVVVAGTSFILILLSGEDLTSFNINDRTNFIDEKKQK